MNKNHIFIGVIVGAIGVAAIGNFISPESAHSGRNGWGMSMDGEDHHRRGSRPHSGDKSTVEFNGKTYRCNKETGSVELTHDDGSITVVTCD
jgi:hypothetical protein